MAGPGGHHAAPRPLTDDLAAIRLETDTHFFGTRAVTRAFSLQLAAQGSSAVLNILSALS